MTMMQVLTDFDPVTKKPIFVLQHPFFVLGGRPKMDHAFSRYEKVDGRMRHVAYRPATRQVIVMHRKGGPRPERFPSSFNLQASTSRQVRRQLERMPRLVEQR
jgi:hypothetical protein